MKAIVCHGYGSPDDVLRFADIDEPVVTDNEVLVRVHAASVNPADWHLVRGTPYIARLQVGLRKPSFRVPGCDVAGRVEAVGKNVTKLQPGDEVFGSPFMRGFGAFAERVSVSEDALELKPTDLSFDQAAAVPLAASTALQGLRDHGRIEPGQNVLIIGASGGVGTFAVQIAKSLDAEVTGVCSTRNVNLVRSLALTMSSTTQARTSPSTGSATTSSSRRRETRSPSDCRRVLTSTGTLVQISGDSDNRWIGPVSRIITARLLSPFISQRMATFTVNPNTEDLQVLKRLIETGGVTPVVDRTYSLSEIADAIRYQEEGHTQGKVIITV